MKINTNAIRFFGVLLFIMAINAPIKSQVKYDHFVRLGQMDLQKSNYLEAINNFNTAIYSKKEGFEAYFLRGIAKFSLGDFQGAINDFSKTISLHPLYVRAYHYRGISRDRMYDYALAISDFDKALKIDPFNPEIFLARGDTKLHLNDYKGAVDDYTSAIELDNEQAAAWLNRGVARHLLEAIAADDAVMTTHVIDATARHRTTAAGELTVEHEVVIEP